MEENLKHLSSIKADKKKLEDIPIIRDFPKVLPDDSTRLPLILPVEFRINLIPEATPVSKAPYRLTPFEIQELSNQLQEFQDKGFIIPSDSICIPATQGAREELYHLRSRAQCDGIRRQMLETLPRRWIELLSDYDCEIRYHHGKENVVADALSRKERVKPVRVRAMNMTICSDIKGKILKAQREAFKEVNVQGEALRGFHKQIEHKEDDAMYFVGGFRFH
ncbi:hypothetical protein Tco_0981961 [Tanacetum coccineum]